MLLEECAGSTDDRFGWQLWAVHGNLHWRWPLVESRPCQTHDGVARELHTPSHLSKSGSCVETARRVHLTEERPSVEPLLGSG